MVSLIQLWLPIVLSAVFVFFASSLINMVLGFWHRPDYLGFANEEEVRTALRHGLRQPGVYVVPFCPPESMRDPQTKQKFAEGPIGMVALKPGAPMSMGKPLAQWFVFCVAISFLCALVAVHCLQPGSPGPLVFHTFALAGLLGHSSGPATNAIWWSHTWKGSFKYMVDGLVYALIIGATFAWLWPQ